MDLREVGSEDGGGVDITGSGSCPMAISGANGTEPSGSVIRQLFDIIIIIILSL
jgi:hypothetical protein